MRVKTPISLPSDLLRVVDRAAGGRANRSRYIERAVRAFVEAQSKADRDGKDIELINRHARRLNAEAADVLAYQR